MSMRERMRGRMRGKDEENEEELEDTAEVNDAKGSLGQGRRHLHMRSTENTRPTRDTGTYKQSHLRDQEPSRRQRTLRHGRY